MNQRQNKNKRKRQEYEYTQHNINIQRDVNIVIKYHYKTENKHEQNYKNYELPEQFVKVFRSHFNLVQNNQGNNNNNDQDVYSSEDIIKHLGGRKLGFVRTSIMDIPKISISSKKIWDAPKMFFNIHGKKLVYSDSKEFGTSSNDIAKYQRISDFICDNYCSDSILTVQAASVKKHITDDPEFNNTKYISRSDIILVCEMLNLQSFPSDTTGSLNAKIGLSKWK